ncbi:uncharacterized protein LY89DRAFT_445989 [Mollisia scopiformis]|uniref:Uncharacterized protein n=1 Tax=Mollisia scopiformis TaxID=149040 RepID=A0A194XK47_MOLSC|nr:uncharacterized protein LY89DRAFT_445989 [Mollisia scopiformis]KUJ20533.1 hypothetical protein LY89DRAFT_445989 [Mollisia scopiformis]
MSPTEVIRSSNISSGFTIFNLHLFLKEVISNFSLLNSIQLLFFAISYHWLLHICHLHLLHFLPRSRNTANLSSLLLSLIVRPQLPAYSLWPFRLQPFNMAIPDHNNTDSTHHYEESIDQWICSQCFKTVSPTRPPVFNPENCSCVEAGGGGPVSQPRTEEQPLYGYDNTMNQPSYASSVVSFTGPEGPERENPNMQITNNYLPLGPDTGLNETQHRRSASFESDMSYQMRRFLVEEGYVNEEHRFLQWGGRVGVRGI